MQCKDVPTLKIMEFLARRKTWAFWYAPDVAGEASICHAMPPGVPSKIRIAKMNKLIRSGLVDGCSCGCRGDYEISEKGRYWLDVSDQSLCP